MMPARMRGPAARAMRTASAAPLSGWLRGGRLAAQAGTVAMRIPRCAGQDDIQPGRIVDMGGGDLRASSWRVTASNKGRSSPRRTSPARNRPNAVRPGVGSCAARPRNQPDAGAIIPRLSQAHVRQVVPHRQQQRPGRDVRFFGCAPKSSRSFIHPTRPFRGCHSALKATRHLTRPRLPCHGRSLINLPGSTNAKPSLQSLS